MGADLLATLLALGVVADRILLITVGGDDHTLQIIDAAHTPHITAVEGLIHDIGLHHTAGLLLADVTGPILPTILLMTDIIIEAAIVLFQGTTLRMIDITEAGDTDLFLVAYHQGIGGLPGDVIHQVPHQGVQGGVTRAVSHRGTLIEATIEVLHHLRGRALGGVTLVARLPNQVASRSEMILMVTVK